MSPELETIQACHQPWHDPLLEQIVSLQSQQRLPHAILIDARSERDGIDFLWHLSMLLLCEKPDNISPCQNCHACELMISNNYPDFVFLTPQMDDKTKKISKNIKIEQIRTLINEEHLTRRYRNLKIICIYPADKMSIASANSLLKTLEEPSQNTLILLMTHRKGRIPITILSRCQSWTLEHPKRAEALAWLAAQGMDSDESQRYLDYAGRDPQLALELKLADYAAIVDSFKQRFTAYLKNEIDAAQLGANLMDIERPLMQRVLKMVTAAYCHQLAGVSGTLQKRKARLALDLFNQVNRQLLTEENNLDLKLQLEDVLISLKQIIKWRAG